MSRLGLTHHSSSFFVVAGDYACTNRDLFTDFGLGLESVKIHIDPPLTSLPSSILDLLKPPKWTIC